MCIMKNTAIIYLKPPLELNNQTIKKKFPTIINEFCQKNVMNKQLW